MTSLSEPRPSQRPSGPPSRPERSREQTVACSRSLRRRSGDPRPRRRLPAAGPWRRASATTCSSGLVPLGRSERPRARSLAHLQGPSARLRASAGGRLGPGRRAGAVRRAAGARRASRRTTSAGSCPWRPVWSWSRLRPLRRVSASRGRSEGRPASSARRRDGGCLWSSPSYVVCPAAGRRLLRDALAGEGITSAARPRRTPSTEVDFESSDGLRAHRLVRPDAQWRGRDRRPGRSGVDHARMLARHGYGVLLMNRRGEGDSEGDTNLFGWGGHGDIAAATDFLRSEEGIAPDAIGGLGLSVGGEVLLEHAATCRTTWPAWWSEGIGSRSIKESLELSGGIRIAELTTAPLMTGSLVVFTDQAASAEPRRRGRRVWLRPRRSSSGARTVSRPRRCSARRTPRPPARRRRRGRSRTPGTPAASTPPRRTTSAGSSPSSTRPCSTSSESHHPRSHPPLRRVI